MSAIEHVRISRSKGRPTGLFYINRIFDEFIEMHGDRRYGDDKAVVGGIARLNDMPVTVIAQEKGSGTTDKVKRNFGSPHPEGYRKALRLMKQAEKFGRPIVNFVDTSGAFCDVEAEERGQAQAIAENLVSMMGLTVPVISVFIGEGGSGGALALAVADEIWMLEYATFSVISPEGCAAILWKDSSKVEQAADCLKLTAQDLSAFGIADRVLSEASLATLLEDLKSGLYSRLKELASEDTTKLLENRYDKYRAIGAC